jgi:uncharacterized membrane protein YdjX (TVP38/TMEM64 family)
MSTTQIQLAIVILVLVCGFFYFDLPHYLNLEYLKAQQQSLEKFKDSHFLQALIGYALIYIVVTALSLPGAIILTLAGGALFGVFWGTLIVSFASSIGATVAFLAARFLFRDWVNKRFGERLVAINAGISRDGLYYLFTLRLVPLFPFFMINLLMGLTTIKPFSFYWVSQIGMLAGTLVFVNAGTQLANIETLSGILSPVVVGSFTLLGVFPIVAKKILENFPGN